MRSTRTRKPQPPEGSHRNQSLALRRTRADTSTQPRISLRIIIRLPKRAAWSGEEGRHGDAGARIENYGRSCANASRDAHQSVFAWGGEYPHAPSVRLRVSLSAIATAVAAKERWLCLRACYEAGVWRI
ncbi:hypothetical protein M758_1G144000 [Ceratodon purpureus]|nr:hypothetical protein M758_1G144000 [Ceratodon purpureus]